MRMRFVFLGVSACLVAAGFVEACGGSSEDGGSTADAGHEAAAPDTGAKDTGAQDTGPIDSGPPCDTTKYFLADVPDASLADGATTSGICLGCLQAKCNSALESCNKDCNCRDVVSAALDCYTKGGSIFQCVGSSKIKPTQKTQQIGIQIAGCMQSLCNDECAFDSFFADAGDASDQ